MPFSPDLNGRMQEGVGYSQMTRKGRFRGSTAQTFLAEAKGRRKSADRDRRLGNTPAVRGQALRRRRIPPAWTGARDACGARGDPVRRRGQLAAAAADFRHRSGGASASRSAWRWCMICRASAPICRTTTSRACRIGSKNAVSINQLAHGMRLAAEAVRFVVHGPGRTDIRRDQRAGVLPIPARDLPALTCNCCSRRQATTRHGSATGTRGRDDRRGMSGAAGQPRHDHGALCRSVRGADHHAELSVGPERSARAVCRDADHAADLRRAGDGAAQRRGNLAGPRRRFGRCAGGLRAPLRHDDLPPGRHLPDGRRTRLRWSMRGCACTAWAACG